MDHVLVPKNLSNLCTQIDLKADNYNIFSCRNNFFGPINQKVDAEGGVNSIQHTHTLLVTKSKRRMRLQPRLGPAGMRGGRREVLGLTRSTQPCLEYVDARNQRRITSQRTEDAESPKVHGEAWRTPPAPVSCRLQCRAGAGIVLLTRHHQRRYCAVNEVPSAPVSSRLRGPAGASVVRSTRLHQRQYRAVNEAPPAPVSCG